MKTLKKLKQQMSQKIWLEKFFLFCRNHPYLITTLIILFVVIIPAMAQTVTTQSKNNNPNERHTEIAVQYPKTFFTHADTVPMIALQPPTAKMDLQTLIKQVPIRISDFYAEQSALHKEIDKKINQIRKMLPKSINNQRLIEILRSPDFAIVLVPETYSLFADTTLKDKNGEANTANADAESNKIFIVFKPKHNDEKTRETLSNELHHASINLVNALDEHGRFLPSPETAVPFFNRKAGKLDQNLFEQVETALIEASKRIIDLSTLLDKNDKKEKLTSAEVGRWVTYRKVFSGAGAQPKSNISRTLARKFIQDYLVYVQNLNSGIYQSHNKEIKRAELLSFIEQLSPAIKNFFFKELCDYLSTYTDTADYCHHPSI